MSESDDSSDKTSASVSKRAPRKAAGPRGILAVGYVLNGIYEVKRFLARGGMGEVYEGVNVNADERVAIKVILPHLAADPKVQAMFRKEAKTLTSLAHPALVQYRVLAREPRKELLYIVTDFIDGEPLTNLIGRVQPNPYELVMLTRRLAQGLGAAHSHGAIHRDMSPDNVLLPSGILSQAKIIDFGIAKSMDVGAQTVVGDGFAGKLGYVAPEQFGDFDRRIGPWTDVYSLALVTLALAGGAAPDMGTTLVEAIDRRRAGPVLAVLPEVLRPLFAKMLAANPADRFQSMDEVIAALDALNVPYEAPSAVAAPTGPPPPVEDSRTVIGSEPASSWGAATPPAEGKSGSWGSEPAAPAVDHGPKTVFAPSPIEVSAAPAPMPAAATPEPEHVAAPKPAEPPKAEAKPEPAAAAPAAPAPAVKAEKPAKAEKPVKPPPPPKPPKPPAPEGEVAGKKPPIGLIAAAVVGVIVIGLAFMLWPKGNKPAPAVGIDSGPAVASGPISPVETAVAAALPQVDCAWLTLDRSGGADGSTLIKVAGVAADPIAVNKAVATAAQGAGAAGVQVDTAQVFKAPPAACPLLAAVRASRAPDSAAAPGVVAQQAQFEVNRGIQGCPAGLWAQSLVTVTTDQSKSFSLIGILPSGKLQQLIASREQFASLAKRSPDQFKDLGGGRYRVSTCQAETGLAGMLFIEGAAPFDLGLRASAARPPANFADKLSQTAKAQGWTTQLAWFHVVNNQPDLPENAAPPPTQTVAEAPGAAVPEPAAAAAPPPVAAPAAAPVAPPPGEWVACRRYVNGAWEEMGYGNQATCIQRLFVGHCETTTGQSGDNQLRRYNGFIQSKPPKRFSSWVNVTPSEACPK